MLAVVRVLLVLAVGPGWGSLYRPLKIPHLAPGSPCPVSRIDTSVDFRRYGVGRGYGPGPAYPIGLAAGRLSAVWNTGEFSGGWGGQKVLWWVHPRYRGPVLIRGRRLDGPEMVRFDRGSPPPAELRIRRVADESVGKFGRSRPSYTRLRAPGCYAYQFDGLTFSRIVVFRATGTP
jgi:hypothetical protein